MTKTPIHHFRVRFPKDLFESIADEMRRSGGKSLNKEIVERLGETRATDAASQIANVLRPHLNKLDEVEREQFGKLIVDMAELIARRPRRRSRKPNDG